MMDIRQFLKVDRILMINIFDVIVMTSHNGDHLKADLIHNMGVAQTNFCNEYCVVGLEFVTY